MTNVQESYKGFDINQTDSEIIVRIDTPDGSFRQSAGQPITSIEEAKKLIDEGAFRKTR